MNDANDPNGNADQKLAARRAALQRIGAVGIAAPVMVAMLSGAIAPGASTGSPTPTPTPTPLEP